MSSSPDKLDDPMRIESFSTWHWEYEVEADLIMRVDYEVDCPEEGVTITIKDRKIKLWEDEVAPLIKILGLVRAKHDEFITQEYKK